MMKLLQTIAEPAASSKRSTPDPATGRVQPGEALPGFDALLADLGAKAKAPSSKALPAEPSGARRGSPTFAVASTQNVATADNGAPALLGYLVPAPPASSPEIADARSHGEAADGAHDDDRTVGKLLKRVGQNDEDASATAPDGSSLPKSPNPLCLGVPIASPSTTPATSAPVAPMHQAQDAPKMVDASVQAAVDHAAATDDRTAGSVPQQTGSGAFDESPPWSDRHPAKGPLEARPLVASTPPLRAPPVPPSAPISTGAVQPKSSNAASQVPKESSEAPSIVIVSTVSRFAPAAAPMVVPPRPAGSARTADSLGTPNLPAEPRRSEIAPSVVVDDVVALSDLVRRDPVLAPRRPTAQASVSTPASVAERDEQAGVGETAGVASTEPPAEPSQSEVAPSVLSNDAVALAPDLVRRNPVLAPHRPASQASLSTPASVAERDEQAGVGETARAASTDKPAASTTIDAKTGVFIKGSTDGTHLEEDVAEAGPLAAVAPKGTNQAVKVRSPVSPTPPPRAAAEPPQRSEAAPLVDGMNSVSADVTAPALAALPPPVRQVAAALARLASESVASSTVPDTDAAPARPALARTLTLQISPAASGTVAIKLHATGGALDVQLIASDAGTAALLSRDHDVLAASLQDRHTVLHSLVIQDGSGGSQPGGHHASRVQTPGAETGARRQGGDAGPDGDGRQRRERPEGQPRREGAGEGRPHAQARTRDGSRSLLV